MDQTKVHSPADCWWLEVGRVLHLQDNNMNTIRRYLAVRRGLRVSNGTWCVMVKRGDRFVVAHTGSYESCAKRAKLLHEECRMERRDK